MDDQTQPSPEKNSDETVEIELSSTVLDLTSFQLHDLASVELPPALTELDLTANRLSSLDPRISHLSNLTKLSFRHIDDAAFEPISRLVSSLEDLWLNDNQIESLESIAEAVAGSKETQEKSVRVHGSSQQLICSKLFKALLFSYGTSTHTLSYSGLTITP
ncbi:hypothetical protein LWI29_022816 [Acer saccharum]|uniref:Uncharacterized protein n=1 Tax=Acer saccharum TaxID=4024 RepID=A0AA39TGF0_ACESA|nr:hypothetical protein LWI29_022816 [Acer saccharum]